MKPNYFTIHPNKKPKKLKKYTAIDAAIRLIKTSNFTPVISKEALQHYRSILFKQTKRYII